jgi:hypothetical protein
LLVERVDRVAGRGIPRQFLEGGTGLFPKGKVVSKWPTRPLSENFPMALDEARKEIIMVFRAPPRLVVASLDNGAMVSDAETCADSDDVFADSNRHRIYVSCGEGFVDIFAQRARLQRIGDIPTMSAPLPGRDLDWEVDP